MCLTHAAYMHRKVQAWLSTQLDAQLHGCTHASDAAKATVRALLQMDPAARLLPHQLLAPGSWLNPSSGSSDGVVIA
jgi:hypothetical protein